MLKDEIIIGAKFKTRQGCTIEIIAINNLNDITIKFLETGNIRKTTYNIIRTGYIRNYLHKSILGIGYIGIGKYKVSVKRKHTKCYDVWRDTMRRCYDEKSLNKEPTYNGCVVCEKWHNFQNFAEWFYENYKDGYYIDKDLIKINNKVYCPKYCCFVPRLINNILTKSNSARGKYPIGVNKIKNRYVARLNRYNQVKKTSYHKTINEAFYEYKKFKESYIKDVAVKYFKDGLINRKVYLSLLNYKVNITD